MLRYPPPMIPEIAALQALLAQAAYVADRSVATALFLANALERPLLVEGPPGVGKTEIAKVLARTRNE